MSVSEQGFILEGGRLLSYTGQEEEVVVPAGVIRLESGVFADRENLRRVILPDSLRTIGADVFSNCSALEEVVLPQGLEEIENNAFYLCESLSRLEISEGVRSIGDRAFFKCSALQRIVLPRGLRRLGQEVFEHCTGLEELHIPAATTEIGRWILFGATECTVYVEEDSFAHQYCEFEQIDFCTGYDQAKDVQESKGGFFARMREKRNCRRQEAEEEERLRREAEEAERLRREAEEEERRRQENEARNAVEEKGAGPNAMDESAMERLDYLRQLCKRQEWIIAENPGILGEQARRRKMAQARLKELNIIASREFPDLWK